jgi:biopolymer transport protein ExbD
MRKVKARRKLSMTSLIDVIFLLLLFFMLTSTFTRFAEVELTAAGAGGTAAAGTPPLFLKLSQEGMQLNLQPLAIEALAQELSARKPVEGTQAVLVSLGADVSAQRLTDLLVVLRAVPGIKATVLGAS